MTIFSGTDERDDARGSIFSGGGFRAGTTPRRRTQGLPDEIILPEDIQNTPDRLLSMMLGSDYDATATGLAIPMAGGWRDIARQHQIEETQEFMNGPLIRNIERAGRALAGLGFGPIVEAVDIQANYAPYKIQEVTGESESTYTWGQADDIPTPFWMRGLPRVLQSRELFNEWHGRNMANWGRVFTGSEPHEREALSYINVINRYVYGTDRPREMGIHQSDWEKWGIITAGIVNDVTLDPLWMVGEIGALGRRGSLLRRGSRLAQQLGLQKREEQTVSNMMRRYRGMIRAGEITEKKVPTELLRELSDARGFYRSVNIGTPAEQARAGLRGLINVQRPRITAGRLRLESQPLGTRALANILEPLETRFGITDPWSLWDTLRFSSNETRDFAQSMMRQDESLAKTTAFSRARRLSSEMRTELRDVAQTAQADMGVAEVRAKTYAITVEKELQQVARSKATELALEAGNPTRGKAFEDLVASLRRELEYNINTVQENRFLVSTLDEVPPEYGMPGQYMVEGDLSESFVERLRGQGWKIRRKKVVLPGEPTDYMPPLTIEEANRPRPYYTEPIELSEVSTGVDLKLRGYKPFVQEDGSILWRKEGIVPGPSVTRLGHPANEPVPFYRRPGEAMYPEGTVSNVRKDYRWVVEEFPPLKDMVEAVPVERWDTPIIRDRLKEFYQSNMGYLKGETMAGLKVKELTPGVNPLEALSKGESANYAMHRVRPETWEWMLRNGWIKKTAEGYEATENFINRMGSTITPASSTTRTRSVRTPLETFNAYFRDKYADDIRRLGFDPDDFHFFEPNPSMRESARRFESWRRITSAKYFSGFGDRMIGFQSADGAFPFQLPANEAQKVWKNQKYVPESPGMTTLRKLMGETAWGGLRPELQFKLSHVIVPETLSGMFKRQTRLLTNSEHLLGFMRFTQTLTNWWKANTLGIFPAYHVGNFVSNLQLLWLAGMHDPTKFVLAAKIMTGKQGTVKSANGISYTFDELREMMHGHDVYRGYFTGNMEQAVDLNSLESLKKFFSKENKLMEGYFEGDTWVDITGGSLVALTGIDPRPAFRNRTFVEGIKGLSPYGETPETLAALLPFGQEWLPNRVGFMAGGFVEGNARSTMFLHGLLNEGMTPMDAARLMNTTLFDYSKRTLERQIASTAIPFYEFTLQNSMFTLMQSTQRPGKISVPYRLLEFTLPAAAERGVDYDSLPEWMQDRAMVPVGSDKAIDVTRMLPVFELADTINKFKPLTPFEGGPVISSRRFRGITREGVSQLNPALQLGLGLMTGVDPYTERELEDVEGAERYVELGFGDKKLELQMPELIHYIFKKTSRLYSELARGDVLRSVGISRYQESPGTQLHFARRSATVQRQRNVDYAHDVLDEKKTEESQQEALGRAIDYTAQEIAILLSQYRVNEQPEFAGGGPFVPYTRESGIRDRFDLLNEASGLITSPNHGLLRLIREDQSLSTEERDRLLTHTWESWAEIEQWKFSHLMFLAQTTPQFEQMEREGDETGMERRTFQYYDTALGELRQAAGVEGIGPLTYGALRNHFNTVLESMADHGMQSGTYEDRPNEWITYRLKLFDESYPELAGRLQDILRQGQGQGE